MLEVIQHTKKENFEEAVNRFYHQTSIKVENVVYNTVSTPNHESRYFFHVAYITYSVIREEVEDDN